MILKLFALTHFLNAADVSEESARYECEKFYASQNLHQYGVELSLYGEGLQGLDLL